MSTEAKTTVTLGGVEYDVTLIFEPKGVTPLPTITATVVPSSIQDGQSAVLSWQSTNAASVTLQVGAAAPTGAALNGSVTFSPALSTTYTLRASNAAGVAMATATVTVTPVTPPTGGVVYDVNTDTLIDTVLVGDDPGLHGLHVDHPTHPPRFFGVVTIAAVAEGLWSNPATWDAGRLPVAGDVVRVPSKLSFQPGASLRVNLLAVNTGGELSIGNGADVVLADGPFDPLDQEQWGHGLIACGTGKLRVRGTYKTPFLRTAFEPLAGSATLVVEETPVGWLPGDKLVVGDTRQLTWQENPGNPSANHEYQTEVVAVASVSGNVITLAAPLRFNHLCSRNADGTMFKLPHVGNLTRDAVIRSENPDGVRGHILFHGSADVDFENAELRDLGRTAWEPLGPDNIRARYSWHRHHHDGPADIRNCSIWNTSPRRWGIVHHASHNGETTGNVVYNFHGFGIGCEDGAESNNLIDGNLVLQCVPPNNTSANPGTRGYADDVGWEGAGIWCRGPRNRIRNNVCVDCITGRTYWMEGSAQTDTPLLEDSGNECYGGRMVHGFWIWSLCADIAGPSPNAQVHHS